MWVYCTKGRDCYIDPELILGEFDYVITNSDTGTTTRAALGR
jgi:hypothetical protein